MNIQIMANTIEHELKRELGVSLNVASIQALDNAIQKHTWCVDTQRELRAILYQRKCRAVKTYADYLGLVNL